MGDNMFGSLVFRRLGDNGKPKQKDEDKDEAY
jgi:hypothetical protein